MQFLWLIANYITPVMYTDPTGYFADYLLDIPLLILGIIDLIKNPSWAKAGWFTLDLLLSVLPFVPVLSGGRHINKLDDGLDAIRSLNTVDDFWIGMKFKQWV